MSAYVYIGTVHNIGKKLVILLRGRAGWSNILCYNDYKHIVSLALIGVSLIVIRWAQSR